MSIVKEGVEAHGGSIRILSVPQEGTTFTIHMPLVLRSSSTNDSEVAVDPAKNVIDPNSALVLLVDDSASIRRQTTKLIEASGHRVITAVDGAEAMELLLSNVWRPDLILSDVEMPIMDGWQLLECVKNTESLCNIPVIMATSLSDEAHVQLAVELGASDYKIKPLKASDVEGIINDVIAMKAD
jgi:CheY-like chemotaxis protein